MAFASDIFRKISLTVAQFHVIYFWYVNFFIVESGDNNVCFKFGKTL